MRSAAFRVWGLWLGFLRCRMYRELCGVAGGMRDVGFVARGGQFSLL